MATNIMFSQEQVKISLGCHALIKDELNIMLILNTGLQLVVIRYFLHIVRSIDTLTEIVE